MPTFSLDGRELEFEEGDTIIRAAHRAGVDIPHYCWHPGLTVAANCRMCLVEVGPPPGRSAMMLDVLTYDENKGAYVPSKKPKLQPACQMSVSEGMQVKSQTSEHVTAARSAVQEMLLLNHPVDCPICDQAGECRLQDYWLEHGAHKKRMNDEIIHMPKAVDFGPTIVYDAERCIVCTRCVRFCDEVVGDSVLSKRERGNLGEIVLAPGRELDHAYTLMTEHVCPVGALTAKDFRFKARVWFLRSVPSVCQGCATGCNAYTDYDPRKQTVYRHRPRENTEVNQYWMCDEGVLDYRRVHEKRVLTALVRQEAQPFDRALNDAVDCLKAFGNKSAALLSAAFSNEDNLAVIELAKAMGIEKFYLSGRAQGQGDEILRNADKNSNRAGALKMLAGFAWGEVPALIESLREGEISQLLVLGSELQSEELTAAVASAEQVVILATHESRLLKEATVVLPASSWAEAAGTYVNAKGIAQLSQKAIQPLGDSLPAWKLAIELAKLLGRTLPFAKSGEVKAAARLSNANSSSLPEGAEA